MAMALPSLEKKKRKERERMNKKSHGGVFIKGEAILLKPHPNN
jgi:hypothetical protein